MHYLRPIILATLVGIITAASAEEASSESDVVENNSDKVIHYVELEPTFVTNYGVSDTGRLKYVKADITVMVHSKDAEAATRYHLPALRNTLVMLLSRQDDSTVSTATGREVIKAEAVAELREVMKSEAGEAYIQDLMFTNFLVQR